MTDLRNKLQGPMAALLTPRLDSGNPDYKGLERNLDLLANSGIQGIVLAGGTGEYFEFPVDQRDRLLEHSVAVFGSRGAVIAGIGAGNLNDSVALGKRALAAGADCVLLPPPHFYRYEQDDIEAFFRAAADRIEGPILIYNLAAFCSPVSTDTAVRLIAEIPNLIGIKDSSGSLATLQALTEKPALGAVRIVGHDRVLVEGLVGGWIDGVISGPASVLPEMTAEIFAAHAAGDDDRLQRVNDTFEETLAHLSALPYPWALKWIAEWRGLFPAQLPFPPSPSRQAQKDDLERWFQRKLPEIRALAEIAVS